MNQKKSSHTHSLSLRNRDQCSWYVYVYPFLCWFAISWIRFFIHWFQILFACILQFFSHSEQLSLTIYIITKISSSKRCKLYVMRSNRLLFSKLLVNCFFKNTFFFLSKINGIYYRFISINIQSDTFIGDYFFRL